MAIVKNPLTGFMSGSIGLNTFQGWKDRYIMRSKPANQYNPNTQAQQDNRIRFDAARAFYKQNKNIIADIMRRMDRKRAPFNAFAHRNLSLWDKGSDKINVSKLSLMSLGVGDFYFLQSLRLIASANSGVLLAIYIPYTPLRGSEPFVLTAIVYNQTKNTSWSKKILTNGGQDYWYPMLLVDEFDILVVWCCFYSQGYKWMSNTHYAVGEWSPL